MNPFHLAVPVHDLEAAREFYGGILGCTPGRAKGHSIVWNFFGHQVVTHEVQGYRGGPAGVNPVDKHRVPVPHFGLVLDLPSWHAMRTRLVGSVEFVIPPDIRYEGTPGEQATMFFLDPSGNALEIKGFADSAGIFSTD